MIDINTKNHKEKLEQIVIAKLIQEPEQINFVREKLFDNKTALHLFSHMKAKINKDNELLESFELIVLEAQNERFKMPDLLDYINIEGRQIESANYYIRFLTDAYYRIQMQKLCFKSIELLNNPNSDYYTHFESFETLKKEAEGSIDVKVDNLKDNVNNSIKELYDRIEKRKNGIKQYETGWVELDEMVIPEKGHILTIAARPSIGKTSLTNCICKGYAKNKEKGAYFSLEVTTLSLSNRFLLSENDNVDSKAFNKGLSTTQDIEKLEQSVNLFDEIDLYIIDDKYHIDEIIQNIDLLVMKKGITYAVIDFLQIIQADARDDNMKMTIISQKLKACAKRNKIVIIPLSQLNRNVESRGSSRHQLSDLRGSGSLEQDSDIIIFLHRQAAVDIKEGLDVDWHDQETRNIELQVLKNKTGEIGDVKLFHNKTVTDFYDLRQLEIKNNEKEFGGNDEIDVLIENNQNQF